MIFRLQAKYLPALTFFCYVLHAQTANAPLGSRVPSSSLGQNSKPAPNFLKTPGPPRQYNSPEEYRYERMESLMADGDARRARLMLMIMGDEAAADILKIIETRPLRTELEQKMVVEMIHYSFEFPRAVANVANRQPKSSLALLQKLDKTAISPDVSLRVGQEKQFVVDASTRLDTRDFPIDNPNGPLGPYPPLNVNPK